MYSSVNGLFDELTLKYLRIHDSKICKYYITKLIYTITDRSKSITIPLPLTIGIHNLDWHKFY